MGRNSIKQRNEMMAIFDIFIKEAGNNQENGWFHEIACRNPSHAFFANYYSFYVVPRESLNGKNRTVLNVYYGSRPVDHIIDQRFYDQNEKELPFPKQSLRFITECGAHLRYTRISRGSVICILTPATIDNIKQKEDSIIIETLHRPHSLTGKPLLKKHMDYLLSYFECTSVDGDPNIYDKIRIWWLRFTKPMVIDGKITECQITSFFRKIIQWSLTVGLSGAMLFIIQLFFSTLKS